jgi:5-methylcytosine-specific restriction endonuclease McrA
MPVLCDMPLRAWRQLVAEAVGDRLDDIALACRRQRATLIFELWGRRNPHTVAYDENLRLSLHTIVRGRSVLPWRTVAQVARAHGLPLAPVLRRIVSPMVEQVKQAGQRLAGEMERRNDPDRGIYREEGAVLSLSTTGTATLWKFKPPSMSEMHRLTRHKVRPVTIRHELFKLLEAGVEDISLQMAMEAIAAAYGHEAAADAASEIEKVPTVIRLRRYVNVPRRGAAWSKAGVLRRDGCRCIYCGVQPGDKQRGRTLTGRDFSVDHIVPLSRGGRNSWGNTACACLRCNGRKGDRTPAEANMKLLWEPKTPRTSYLVLGGDVPVSWKKYVEV